METRGQILQAVYTSLCQKGYRGTNINAVVLELGLTKGALYYYFKGGKKELVGTVFKEVLQPAFLQEWDTINRKKTQVLRFLNQRIEHSLTLTDPESLRPSPLFRLLSELTDQEPELRTILAEILADLHESLVAAFKRGIAKGKVHPKTKAQQEAWHFLSAYEGALSLGYSLQDTQACHRSLKALQRHLKALAD